MSRIESYGRHEHSPLDESGAPRRSGAPLPCEVQVHNDGLMKITEVFTAGKIVAMSAVSDAGEEKERVFTSEEIDKGKFGAVYHPEKGHELAKLELAFDGKSQCY